MTLPTDSAVAAVTDSAVTAATDSAVIDVDSGEHLTAWKKRRLMRGAANSDAVFDAMFIRLETAANTSLQNVIPHNTDNKDTILGKVAHITAIIQDRHPTWSFLKTRLACAALSLYRMRLVDLFFREHVMLVWIIEGGHRLRVHNGICYMYNDCGAF